MSRGFVKEDDLEHAGTDLPERPLSAHPNYVTPNGLKQLEALANTLATERLNVMQQKDNPLAVQQLSMIERDIRYVSAKLKSAIVNPMPTDNSVILFGATVKVEDEVGEIHLFNLVGEDEADIKQNKVSWNSPIAKALIGQKVGDSVTWVRPAGNLLLDIIEINY